LEEVDNLPNPKLKHRTFGIFLRAVVMFGSVTIITLAIFAFSIYSLLSQTLEMNLKFEGEILTSSISQVTVSSILAEDYSAVVDHCMQVLKEQPNIRFIVISRKDGFSIILTAAGWRQEHLDISESVLPLTEFEFSSIIGENVFRISSPLTYSGIDWGYISLGISLESYNSYREEVIRGTFFIAGFCAFFGLVIAYYFAGRLSNPIRSLEEVVKRVGEGDFAAKVKVETGDEVESLAESFQKMIEALQESRDELVAARDYAADILRTITDPLIVLSPEGVVKTVNAAACSTLGKSEQDLVGHTLDTLFAGDETYLKAGWDKLCTEGVLLNFDTLMKRASGSLVPVLVSGAVMKEKSGKPLGIVLIAKDITDRKRAEEILTWKSEVSKAVADLSGVVIGSDTKMVFIEMEILKQAIRLTESNLGFVGLIDPITGNMVSQGIVSVAGSEYRLEGKEKGFVFPKGNDGKYNALWGHSLNTRKAFFTNSPLSHPASCGVPEEHASIDNFLSVPIIVGADIAGQIALANAPNGFSEFHIEAVSRIAELHATFIQQKRSEEKRNRLEEQLRQSQKMEAIGTLAGGIAHDFNNVLMAIMGFSQLAMEKISEKSDAYADLEDSMKAMKRAAGLVQQILTFSRRGGSRKAPVRIGPIVEDSLKLLRASIPTTISILKEIPRSDTLVLADPIQVQQIVVNLCTNAYYAMIDKGGILTVKVDEKDISEFSAIPAGLVAKETSRVVRLTVEDTGCGIDSSILGRIFEPYFTTKPVGRGTGMGLATVHGIVTSIGGVIDVHSEVGCGSRFDIYFPVCHDGSFADQTISKSVPKGDERILLVDDEEVLVKLTRKKLSSIGYDVSAFTSSVDALKAFMDNPKAFDLVISDQTMPGFTGAELATKILKVRSEIPVLILTGFSETLNKEKALEIGARDLLMKPVSISDLAKAIRRVLDS